MSLQELSAAAMWGNAALWSYLQIRHSIVGAKWVALGWSSHLRVAHDFFFLIACHGVNVLDELSIRRAHHN